MQATQFHSNKWLLPLLLIVASSPAYAAWVVNPSAQVETEYDDNVRDSDVLKEDGLITTATAQLRLRHVSETSQISATGGIGFITYSGADLDDEDTEFADVVALRKFTRATLGLKGTVRRDVMLRTSRFIEDPFADGTVGDEGSTFGGPSSDELLDELVDDSDVDQGAVQRQIRRTRFQIRPYLTYRLSERNQVTLEYSYFDLSYDEDPFTNVRDSKGQTGTASFQRSVTQRDVARVSFAIGDFEPENGGKTDSYEATVGWTHNFSAVSQLGIDLGARRVDNGVTEDDGFVVRLRGNRRLSSGNLDFSLERSIYPSSFGDLFESDSLNVGYQREISDRWRMSLRGRAFQSDSTGSINNNDRDYIEVSPRLSWKMARSWSVDLTYAYRWIDRERDDSSVSSNSVSLSLAFRPPSRL